MANREEFLADVKVGDIIAVFLNNNAASIEGRVVALTNESVKIDTGKGQPKLSIDQIAYYDPKEKEAKETLPVQSVQPVQPVREEKEEASTQTSMNEVFETEIKNAITEIRQQTKEKALTLDAIAIDAKKDVSKSFGQDLHRIIQIMMYGNDSDRLRRAFAELCKITIDEDHPDNRSIFLLQAYVKHMLGEQNEAALLYAKADDFERAVAVAKDQEVLVDEAVSFLKNTKGSIQSLLIIYDNGDDILPILAQILNGGKFCDTHALYAVAVASLQRDRNKSSQLKWPNSHDFFDDENMKYVNALFVELLPRRQPKIIEQPKKQTVNLGTEYRGTIVTLNDNGYGFIGNHNIPVHIFSENLFFYFKQINDDDLKTVCNIEKQLAYRYCFY